MNYAICRASGCCWFPILTLLSRMYVCVAVSTYWCPPPLSLAAVLVTEKVRGRAASSIDRNLELDQVTILDKNAMFTLSPLSTRAWLPPTTRRCTKICWILRRRFYPLNQRTSLSTSSSPLPLPLVSSSRHHHAYGLLLNSSCHLGHWHCGVANVPEVSEFVLLPPIGQDIYACFPRRNQISSTFMSKLDMCIIFFHLVLSQPKQQETPKMLEDNFLRCPWWRTGSVRIAALNSLIKNCVRQCTHILIQPVSYYKISKIKDEITHQQLLFICRYDHISPMCDMLCQATGKTRL